MKKGIIGPFELGRLSALSEVIKSAERLTNKQGTDIEGIFYAAAFQAGIDEFLVPKLDNVAGPKSSFVRSRTTFINRISSEQNYKLVRGVFSQYLVDGWERNDLFAPVWHLSAFLTDLFDAMHHGASLISPAGIPDFAEVEGLLPAELRSPFSILFSSIRDVSASAPILQKFIASEDLDRLKKIISSDLFKDHSDAHKGLDDAEMPIDVAIPRTNITAKSLVIGNRSALRLRRSAVGLLEISPKLIDAAFGKLPGTLADVVVRLANNVLESRRRIVIYDFWPTIEGIWLASLTQILESRKLPPE